MVSSWRARAPAGPCSVRLTGGVCAGPLGRAIARPVDRPVAFAAFAPAIAIAAWLGGAGPAFLTIALSVVASDFPLRADRLLDFGRVEGVALATFTVGWTAVAMLTASSARRVSQERADRLAAERVAAQAHRLAQSTAAQGQAVG